MAQSNVRLLLQRIAAWNAAHPHQPIDPQAELAVARMEGLSGGIGDGGHAFGPNQLNNAGGVLTGKLQGLSPQQVNAWAWSPQGIDYALAGVAKASGGEHGAQAVRDIVTRFERPASPGREIQGALAALGVQAPTVVQQVGAGGSRLARSLTAAPAPAAPAAPAATAAPAVQAVVPQQPVNPTAGLLAALSQAQGGDYSSFYQQIGKALQTRLNPPPAAATAARLQVPTLQPRPLPARTAQKAPVAPLPDSGKVKLTVVPLTLSTRNGIQVNQQVLPDVLKVAQQFGVKVNSGFRSPAHNAQVGGAPNSDHLTGNAVDFTGTPQQMRQLYQWAQGRFPYVEPWAQAGGNHVHISFARAGK